MKLLGCALLLVGACFNPTFNNPACGPNGECPRGTQCNQGVCRSDTTDDATVGDGNEPPGDGTIIDAGVDARVPFTGCQNDSALVACYRFEAMSGLASDGTTHNNDAPCSGSTSIVAGKVGNAMQFNGGNAGCSALSTSSLIGPSAVTLTAWINVTTFPVGTARYGIVDKDATYALHFHGDKTIRCTTNVGMGSAPLTIQTGQWTHVACTYDQSMIRLYQDGVLIMMSAASGPIGSSGTPLTVGMNSPSGDNFVGKLDEVKVWRRALTAAELCDEAGC